MKVLAPAKSRVLIGRKVWMTTASSHELDATLLDIIGSARETCPTFSVPAEEFVAYLWARIPSDVPPLAALRQMHTDDLYLACACARGDVHAFAAFDERCLGHLDRFLRRMGIDEDVCAEVKQEIRRRVLVGDGRPPEIVDFSGRGDLRGWVRVMAVRQALRRQERARRDIAVEDDELLERIVAPGNPELDYAKGMYRKEFKRAFDAALRGLSDRERTLLRQHYIDGLTIDELGQLYRVHRSTAARLLARARTSVLEATRAQMMCQLDVQSQDLDSIMRMIRSQIEISLHVLQRGRGR
jgi:RNA polymerase sigma-70 factor (ECF subfamily)